MRTGTKWMTNKNETILWETNSQLFSCKILFTDLHASVEWHMVASCLWLVKQDPVDDVDVDAVNEEQVLRLYCHRYFYSVVLLCCCWKEWWDDGIVKVKERLPNWDHVLVMVRLLEYIVKVQGKIAVNIKANVNRRWWGENSNLLHERWTCYTLIHHS